MLSWSNLVYSLHFKSTYYCQSIVLLQFSTNDTQSQECLPIMSLGQDHLEKYFLAESCADPQHSRTQLFHLLAAQKYSSRPLFKKKKKSNLVNVQQKIYAQHEILCRMIYLFTYVFQSSYLLFFILEAPSMHWEISPLSSYF